MKSGKKSPPKSEAQKRYACAGTIKRGVKKRLLYGGVVTTHTDTKGFSARRDSVQYRNTFACNKANVGSSNVVPQ